MKKILLLILFLLLFPSIVLAKDTCNHDDIKIEEITIEEKEGNTEELTPVNIDNNKINLNLEMYNVGESITYKIKVMNNSNNDYYFTKDSFNLNTDYIEYSIVNDSEIIKGNEEKSIQLKITYKEKIPEDEFTENNMMNITLSDTPLTNPSTKRTFYSIVLILFITLSVIFISKNKKLDKILIGLILCFIPLSIKAICTINLEITANITINEKEAIFLPGYQVNVKMKELAGDDTSTTNPPYYFQDENIIAIKYSNTEPVDSEKQEKNIVSTPDSPYPIYMWYEEGTIYWWSEDKTPKTNKYGAAMFDSMLNLSNIEGLSSFDLSKTTTLFRFFTSCNLENIDSLQSWNISNVKDMGYMFFNCNNLEIFDAVKNWDTSNVTSMSLTFKQTKIKNLEVLKNWNTSKVTDLHGIFDTDVIESTKGLENWDTSNVIYMGNLFARNNYLTDLSGLKNWDTSKVEDLGQAFLSCTSLQDISPLKDWNVSNVKDIYSLFNNNQQLQDITPLRNWDTSNVTRMFRTFRSCSNLKDLSGLENWNTSNVKDFTQMFYANLELTDISALTSWNTSNVTNMSSMFYNDRKIINVNAINDWDIQNVTSFSYMFRYSPVYPEFSKVQGTWSNGTFTPTP